MLTDICIENLIDYDSWKGQMLKDWIPGNKLNVENLFHYIEMRLKQSPWKVEIKIVNLEKIFFTDGSEYTGLCDTTIPNHVTLYLGVKGKTPEICLEYFCHEFCHYLQWLGNQNGIPSFSQENDSQITQKHEGVKVEREFNISLDEVKNAYRRVILNELDCNQNVLDLLEMFQVNLDRDRMIRGMNAYHMSHFAFFDFKKFYTKDPGLDAGIQAMMPTKLLKLEDLERNYRPEIFKDCFL
jgi:hypothetical protein